MTDEEIVKGLEHKKKIILEEVNRTNNCLDDLIVCVDAELIVGALDLIHRLKGENTELREDVERWEAVYKICEERKYRKMFNEEWKKDYQKELDKQGESLIAGSPDFDYVYELYFKQKAEISLRGK